MSGVIPGGDSISVPIIRIMGALAPGRRCDFSLHLGKEQLRDARGRLDSWSALLWLPVPWSYLLYYVNGNRHLLSAIRQRWTCPVMDNAQNWLPDNGAIAIHLSGLYNACAAPFRSMGNSKVSMMIVPW